MTLARPRRNGAAILVPVVALVAIIACGRTPAYAAGNQRPAIDCPSAACLIASELGEPISVALDGSGNAYLTSQDGRLLRVDLATGTTTTLASRLGNLRGVDVDHGATGYVGDFDGNLQRIDLTTGVREIVARRLGPVHGVVRALGVTYVASGDGRIIAVPDGRDPRVIASGLGILLDLALDGRGNAYAADVSDGSVLRIDLSTGTVTTLVSGLYEPQSIAVSRSGRVYFLSGGEFSAVDAQGGAVTDIGDFGLSGYDFALDTNGSVYLTAGTGDLWRINHLA